MLGRFVLRPAVAFTTAAATVLAYSGLVVTGATPARAADGETTSLVDTLEGLEALVPTVANLGSLGDAVPGTGIKPGGPAGFDLSTLLTQALDLGGADSIRNATTVDDLVDRINDADGAVSGGRTLTFSASKTGTAIAVTLHVDKTIGDTGLDVAGDEPIFPGTGPFAFTTSSGLSLDLDLDLGFTLNYTAGGAAPAYISSPSLSLTAGGSFNDTLDTAKAGLGIIGVRLDEPGPASDLGSTLDLDATLTGVFQDPNNDGKLYFDEPGGSSTTDGELSAAGAGAGLLSVSLTAGTVNGRLEIEADPSDELSLPAVSAVVTLSGNLAAGGIDVSYDTNAFDTVRGFLSLSTRDLAQGLASAASTVMGLQDATGVKLPFMRGDYANAVGAVQAIVKFLEDNVPAATGSDPTPGLPAFASIQELLKMLKDYPEVAGSDISVLTPVYDAAGKKLRFDLKIERTASDGSLDLNPLGTAISGNDATYTDTTISRGTEFPIDVVGRQVVAGTSAAVIDSISGDKKTLTLSVDPVTPEGGGAPSAVRWVGGKPAPGTPYSIAAGDPKIGAVELGDALKSNANGAITNANAKLASAKVTPSFSLTLPIVLDLRDPDTTDCDPGAGTAACPYSYEAGGVTTIISSLPLPADRIMLDLDDFALTADADITTSVDIDATVGFLGVKLKGSLKACTKNVGINADCTGTATTTDHLLTLGLKPAGFPSKDADNQIPFSRLVGDLTQALTSNTVGDVLDVVTKGQAYADLNVSVPGAADFFGGSPTAGVTITMPDIANPTAFTPTPTASIGDLGSFNLDTSDPLKLFATILQRLEALQGIVGDLPGAGALDTKIPVLGRSFNDIVGAGAAGSGDSVSFVDVPAVPASGDNPAVPAMTQLVDANQSFNNSYIGRTVRVGSQESRVVAVPGNEGDSGRAILVLKPALSPKPADKSSYTTDSELQGLINTLQDASSSNLQEMLKTLADRLGVGSSAGFKVLPGTGGDPDMLKLSVDWKRSFVDQSPINVSFAVPGLGDRSLVGASGSGLVETTVDGQVKVSFLIPLSKAVLDDPSAEILVDPDDTIIKASALVESDDLRFSANLGPFEATLGNPTSPVGSELRAGLGFELKDADATDDGPTPLGDFLDGLDLSATGAGAGTTCAGDTFSTPLALCAKFPMAINGIAAGTTPETSNLVFRLPLNTSDLADSLNLGGAAVDGHPRVVVPDNLAATLQDAALNLLSFGDGFMGYLEFAERALRTASFDGKLPLIGKDLQGGADFIGDVRTELETLFGGAVPADTTAGAIRTFVHTGLKDALPTVSDALDLDVTCATPLQPTAAPTVTPNGSGSGTHYKYKIQAVTTVTTGTGTEDKPTTVSGPSTPQEFLAPADLDDTNYLHVAWTGSARATGYIVFRSVDDGPFKNIGTTADLYFDDKVTGDGGAEPEDVPAAERPCADSTPAEEVTGFTVEVSLGQGDPTIDGCKTDNSLPAGQKECFSNTIPVDFGLPGLSLKANDSTRGITAQVGWRLDLKLGFTRDDGFYVDTQEGDDPEFRVGAAVSISDPTVDPPVAGSLSAQVAFLNIDVLDNKAADPEFAGLFSIDLHDSDGKLGLDQIFSADIASFITVKLEADVDLDVHLRASVGSGAALPGIQADFLMTWHWGVGTGDSTSPSDTSDLVIAFNNVKLDAGEFLGAVIRPIVEQVVKVFKPVQPVIDILFERIPVLSDLAEAVGGDPITIASLAQTFSTLAGGPDLQPFLDVLKNIRDLVNALDGDCGASPAPCINIGSFQLAGDKVASTDENPSTAASLIKADDPSDPDDYSLSNNVTDQLEAKNGGKQIDQSGADSEHKGFTFPFLEHPEKIFGLLVGQDVELVEFDSGPLTLGFEFQQSFGPVYAPPPVNIVVGGGASVTLRIAAGFDTYGIRTAIEKGKVDAGILDSLYFKTVDDQGKPIPVVQFEGFLQAGASVSLVVIEVGVVGGVKLTISFYWNDPNNDGKFRFGEFLAAALNNPICLFNVGGELSLFIKVFITLGISPFSVSFDFELVNVVLLEFNLKPNCTPPPPKLGGVSGDTLYLFAGKFGDKAHRAPGYSGDYPFTNAGGTAEEKWVVRSYPAKTGTDPDGDGPKPKQSDEPAKVVVTALGINEQFPDPGENTIKNVVFMSNESDTGKISLTFNGGTKDKPFSKNVIVRTGAGEDNIRTGIGNAVIDSGGGKDQVTTLERTDLSLDPATAPTALVSGGTGPDSITVGNGKDTVLGDKGIAFGTLVDTTVTTANDPDTAANESVSVALTGVLPVTGNAAPDNPGGSVTSGDADQISAGLGGSKIYGNNGGDIIGTANDNPQATKVPAPANVSFYRAGVNRIVGGSGDDRIKSGSAGDTIFTGLEVVIGEDDDGDGLFVGDSSGNKNSVDTGTGTDTVYGSEAQDFVTTHSLVDQTATVYGGGGDDVLIGGLGTDKLYGGPANDYLVAGPATVSSDFPVKDELFDFTGMARAVTEEAITPPISKKLLVGGGGHDRIYGVDGPADIFGDHSDIGCVAPTDPVSKEPAENPVLSPDANSDKADLILGGDGVDTVNAGGGDDYVKVYGEADAVCGSGGADTIFGGSANDLVLAGSGNDKAYGENGEDQVYGNTGDDSLFGGENADRIEGGPGSDFASGGSHNDLVIGGTSKSGEPDDGDQLYGDTGADTLVGDNADSSVIPSYPTDLASSDASLAGTDYVYGGDGDDKAYGGLEDDWVYGGTGNDDLEGNGGADTVYGEAEKDDIIGGSSQVASGTGEGTVGRPDAGDTLSGGAGDDVVAGDNAAILRDGTPTDITVSRPGLTPRRIQLYDLGRVPAPAVANSGVDTISGGDEPDVLLGQGANDTVHGDAADDYVEGGQGDDKVFGDGGQDDVIGGGHTTYVGTGQGRVGQLDVGDTVEGGDGQDVLLGDNGKVVYNQTAKSPVTQDREGMTPRTIEIYDLGDTPAAGTSGDDWLLGQGDADVELGQDGDDRVVGGDGDDYAEGGPKRDLVEGNNGDDDLLGGSSTTLGATLRGQLDDVDVVWGGTGDDLLLGDNAVVDRVGTPDPLTLRLGSGAPGTKIDERMIQLLDLVNGAGQGSTLNEPTGRFGGDYLSGQAGVDVIEGQDGPDKISGGGNDDYAEGHGAGDTIRGDVPLTGVPTTVPGANPVKAWRGTASGDYGDLAPAGQDDLLGGKSEAGFRDGNDTINGDGSSDFILGDNGTAVRDQLTKDGVLVDRIYELRYPATLPVDAAKVRHRDARYPSTRFCSTAQALTCERTGAFGDDTLIGDDSLVGNSANPDGDDVIYAQDGNDTVYGGPRDDDLYGELGDDRVFGNAGEDAILGDRGGIRDRYEDGSNTFFQSVTQVPKVEYEGFSSGTVTRIVDLYHDVDGDVFVGSGTTQKMLHNGIDEGGNDRLRGGTENDWIHAGFGDDLANGDSGGDTLFGDNGADVMWGGKGCDAGVDTPSSRPYCYPGGTFDPAPHNPAGETWPQVTDYLFGGKGGTSAASIASASGSDVLDWRPRGSYAPGTGCTTDPWPKDVTSGKGKNSVTTTQDPCSWFEMTDLDTATDTDNQHHQGVDWQYGGWDRDVLQGDLADNGPNEGDRLLDWNGAYNLYTHCNSAYGGFNDVRQHAPAWQEFLQKWAYAEGAGQAQSDASTGNAGVGTSAFVELALVYPGVDNDHGSGSAYPSTPGHFENPNACAP